MATEGKKVGLSHLLSKFKEAEQLRGKATFWFGVLLSLAEQQEHKQLNDDCGTAQKVQILRIVSHGMLSISDFYEKERPDAVYKLLNFAQQVFQWLSLDTSFYAVLSTVSYLNMLSIYAIKTRQYSLALDIFSQIFVIFQQRKIDTTHQVFLTFLNNYLNFLRKASHKQTSRLLQVQNCLKDLWIKLFTRVMQIMVYSKSSLIESHQNNIIVLSCVFKQNKILFQKYEKDLNYLIELSFSFNQSIKSNKSMLSKDRNTSNKDKKDMISQISKEKINKNIVFRIQVYQNELKFFSRKLWTRSTIRPKKSDGMVQTPQNRLNKIQTMLQQSIDLLNDQKIQKIVNASQTLKHLEPTVAKKTISFLQIESQSKTIQTLQPKPVPQLPRYETKRRSLVPRMQTKKPQRIQRVVPKNLTPITFKIHSIFIQVNEDGLLLSDYTKQNKRYLEWQMVSFILKKIQLHFPIQETIKYGVQTYYDTARMLSTYLKRGPNRQMMIVADPQPLLEVNQLVKLYRQQGNYLKLALMNQYDSAKFVGVIDCFISEYDQFFKKLSDNEYMIYLNEQITRGVYQKRQGHFLMDYLKRKRETTVMELSNQLQAGFLQKVFQQKNALYKCLFLMKNNKQLYFKIIDNVKSNNDDNFQDYMIEIHIDSLENYRYDYRMDQNQKIVQIHRVLSVPINKMLHYFPTYKVTLRQYLSYYGRLISDLVNDFQSCLGEVNLGHVGLNVIVHASMTQPIQYGRYYSIVSAELIGSKQRIWGLLIRFYDMAFVDQKLTLMINPYNDFMKGIVTSSNDQKQSILKNILVQGSVKETYLSLKRKNKLEKKMNIFEYLYDNNLI